MSRKFNGTSDGASASVDLSAFSVLSISFWAWWDTYGTNDKMMIGYNGAASSDYRGSFFIDPNESTNHLALYMGASVGGGVPYWRDYVNTKPTVAAWHHYCWIPNRATPLHILYVDGVVQALTASQHSATTYGNFGNYPLSLMGRDAGSTLNGAGRMAELAIWGGVILTASEAKALAVGANPFRVHPDGLTYYAPLQGDSPEPDYSGNRKSATLTGTTVVAHPPVTPGFFPRRGFQPMPI